jgi:hypothetical protein
MSNAHRAPCTQRSHTNRSARKLGSIFGATPRVVDGFDSLGDSSDASSILSTGSSSSSLSFSKPFGGSKSFKLSRSSRGSDKAPALILLPMDALPVHSHYPGPEAISPLPSPEDVHPSSTATRRRQLNKVTRTLGENIPPELIFGIPPTKFTTKAMMSLGRRRGKSLSVSGNEQKSQAQQQTASARYARRPSVDVSNVPRDMPFYGSWDAVSPVEDSEPHQRSCASRAEYDWEGAWNRQSMGEVRSKLRSLKA